MLKREKHVPLQHDIPTLAAMRNSGRLVGEAVRSSLRSSLASAYPVGSCLP